MADERPGRGSRIIRWIDYRLPFMAAFQHELYEYPTPRNLTYWWNFGSLGGITVLLAGFMNLMIASGKVAAFGNNHARTPQPFPTPH